MKNIELLVGISNIILDSKSNEEALKAIVEHLRVKVRSDVCSIYLLDKKENNFLTLKATSGLQENAIGKVKLKQGEGLVGQTLIINDYFFVNNATRHPSFKYFPGIGEDPFTTFIGIPLKTRLYTFGILVFQFKKHRKNTITLKKVLTAASIQVSGIILRYYVTDYNNINTCNLDDSEIILRGIPLAEGISIGKPIHIVYNYIEQNKQADIEQEIQLFDDAVEKTKNEIKDLIYQLQVTNNIDADIFNSHLLILEDYSYIGKIRKHIEEYKKSAAISILAVTNFFTEKFNSFADLYLKERSADLEDISQRLLSNLGVLSKNIAIDKEGIVIADRITPGEAATFNIDKVLGFITQRDGLTSHTAILARSMQIPAVTGILNIIRYTEMANSIILDGYSGDVIINPKIETIKKYEKKNQEYHKNTFVFENFNPCELSKKNIKVMANISSLLDVHKAIKNEADGIGLFRTEIYYLQNDGTFDVNKHILFYKNILKSIKNKVLTLRLLDIGSDKKSTHESYEANPALGLRGARLLLQENSLLNKQLEAIASIADYEHLRILIPFISDINEYIVLKNIVLEKFNSLAIKPPLIGCMIEVPSIVFNLDELVNETDFLSIGTNDLFQYFYAIDRTNPYVSSLYKPTDNTFIKLMRYIYDKLISSGKPFEICGEIAAEKDILLNLIDIGYKHFSVNPYIINKIKYYICSYI